MFCRKALTSRPVRRFGLLEALEDRKLLTASSLAISEFMASNDRTLLDADGKSSDWIEIHNPGNEAADLTGWHLTDSDSNLTKWTFPSTSLGSSEFLVVFASGNDRTQSGAELHTNFKLSGSGEYLALVQPDGQTINTAFAPQYPPQTTDVSYGISIDGQRRGYFTTPTPGAMNTLDPLADPTRQVVINELMYHPSSEVDAEEYIELHNIGENSVSLDGWSFVKGVEFTFPSTSIPGGGYLVVAADPDLARVKYPGLANVVGPWIGRLSNSGETISLADDSGTVIDTLTYADEGDWAQRERGPRDNGTRGWVWSDDHDGGGKSLELINSGVSNAIGQNWAASITVQGTPGAANSVVATDTAPFILDVTHSPVIPRSSDPVIVSARLQDEASDATAEVFWRVDSGNFRVLAMRDDGQGGDTIAGDGIVSATIPAQSNNAVVEFYVHAIDTTGNGRNWPASTSNAGQATNLLYQVDDRFDANVSWTPGSPPVYYQIMTPVERSTFKNIDRQSDAQMNATFIAITGTGTEVRYNAGVRIRGSSSRDDDPPNNRINIPSDRPYQGVTALNMNEKRIRNQIAGSALFRLVGLPAAEAKGVVMYSNGVNLYGNQLYTHVEPLNQDLVSNQFPLDNGGNLYKGRRPNESPAGGRGAGLAYFGEESTPYVSYIKQTNESTADWSDVIHLTDVLNNTSDAEYINAVEQVVDVDQWLRFFAMNVLLNNTEGGLVNGDNDGDDYAMYRGNIDTRFKMVPHDLDSLFSNVDDGIYDMAGNPALNRFINHPEILSRYYAQLKDLANNVLTTERAELTLNEALQNVSSSREIRTIVKFIKDRANFVLSRIPEQTLTVESSLPRIGEFHRSTSDQVSLSGAVSDETASVLVNGNSAEITGRERTWSIGSGTSGPADTLIARGSSWSYLDNGTNQRTAWRSPDFSLSASWKSGRAELGYGDNDERTVVDFGSSSSNKHITTYFRREFDVSNLGDITALKLGLLRDDGAAVYLNGVEVARDNLPSEAGYRTEATSTVGGGDEETFYEFSVDPSLLVEGRNVVAVEVHQAAPNSSDISFNLELEAFRQGDVTGLHLNPGINRLVVESFDGPNGTGARIDSAMIDVWYDDGNVQNVSGTLPASPVVWTAADGPYRVTGDLVVPRRGQLTIEPGTSIYFEADASLEVRGTLVAEGTEHQRIRFTSVPNSPLVPDEPNGANGLPDAPPHWKGIQFISSRNAENLVSFTDIEYAQTSDGSIGVSNSEAIVDNVTIGGTHLRMIRADASSLIVQNSIFPDMFAENEIPARLGLDNVSEHIKATGTIPRDGHFIIRNNVFGTNKGHNDVIDADSGRRPDPIVQILDNVFLGSGDEAVDLGGDAYIAGNVFMNVFKDDETSDRGYANAISTGDAGSDTTTVVARNVFWNVDHAINLKRDAATIFENNTVVGIHDDFNDRFNNPNIGSAINFYVDEPGATAGSGAYAAGNIFWDSPRVFGNVDQINTTTALQFENNLFTSELANSTLGTRPGTLSDLGNGNVVGDPRFLDALLGDFRLGPGSAATWAGVLGSSQGATVPKGIVVSGQPLGTTGSRDATLTVGGAGIFGYRYRVNGGAWSDDLSIGGGFAANNTIRTAEIRLENLPNGLQTVEVLGQDFAGEWQTEPTELTWRVDANPQIILSEVLASNAGAFEHAGTRPDYVELRNIGGTAINLKGFSLSDDASKPRKFTFAADTIVQPGDFLTVYADSLDASPGIHLGFSLNSGGEGVYLTEPAASGESLLDSVSFGPQVDNFSISRLGPEQLWQLSLPTPDALNEMQLTGDPSSLRINEWLTSDEVLADFIELYNPDSLPVALEGLFLTDELGGAPTMHQLPPLSYVGGNGFVSLSADRIENLGFKLSSDQEGLAILDADQHVIDIVIYYPQTTGVSQGRSPDGANAYEFYALPSPGRSNGSSQPGDFNGDDLVDVEDVNSMCTVLRVGANDGRFDLTNDGLVDSSDLQSLIRDVLKTVFGDANLDGKFNSTDLVLIFQAGEYEDQLVGNSTWSTGDWNCDGEFSTRDLVVAFQGNGYTSAAIANPVTTSGAIHASRLMPWTETDLAQKKIEARVAMNEHSTDAETERAVLDRTVAIDSIFAATAIKIDGETSSDELTDLLI